MVIAIVNVCNGHTKCTSWVPYFPNQSPWSQNCRQKSSIHSEIKLIGNSCLLSYAATQNLARKMLPRPILAKLLLRTRAAGWSSLLADATSLIQICSCTATTCLSVLVCPGLAFASFLGLYKGSCRPVCLATNCYMQCHANSTVLVMLNINAQQPTAFAN